MNKTILATLTVAALSALSANAIVIKVGSAIPANSIPGGLGKADIESWLDGQVLAYNAAPTPDLPYPPGLELAGGNIQNGGKSTTVTTGVYDYVVLHWGGGRGGGQVDAWYIGPIGGAVPPTVNFDSPTGGGISFVRYYHATPNDPRVPDTGTTLALLGAGLIGVGALRRKS